MEVRKTDGMKSVRMVAGVEERFGKLIPYVALYHSYDSHYALLVKDDCRIALLGVLTGAVKEVPEMVNANDFPTVGEWKTVQSKK